MKMHVWCRNPHVHCNGNLSSTQPYLKRMASLNSCFDKSRPCSFNGSAIGSQPVWDTLLPICQRVFSFFSGHWFKKHVEFLLVARSSFFRNLIFCCHRDVWIDLINTKNLVLMFLRDPWWVVEFFSSCLYEHLHTSKSWWKRKELTFCIADDATTKK